MLFPNKRKYIGIGQNQLKISAYRISAKIQYRASLVSFISWEKNCSESVRFVPFFAIAVVWTLFFKLRMIFRTISLLLFL